MGKLDRYCISPYEDLKTAMRKMTQNRRGILFVINEAGHLLGLLSDGDIRRAITNDSLLIVPVNKIMNIDPVTIQSPNLSAAKEMMENRGITALPVVDEKGTLCDVLFMYKGTIVGPEDLVDA